jgi:hypothetical protein
MLTEVMTHFGLVKEFRQAGYYATDAQKQLFKPTFSRLFRTKNNIAEKKLQETVKSESAYW